MESVYCINCGSASGSMFLENERIRHIIQQWVSPRLVQHQDLICTICWTEASENTGLVVDSSSGKNCALCNIFLPFRTRSHQIIALRRDTQHYLNIRSIVLERLAPLQARASHYICHSCWQRADRAARHYSATSPLSAPTTSNAIRCAYCGIHLNRMGRYILSNIAILSQVQQHVAPQVVTENDYICRACHNAFTISEVSLERPSVGHQNVCMGCGSSLSQGRNYVVQEERNRHILHIVQSWILPREVQPLDLICHRCKQRAEMAIRERHSVQNAQIITLPNYTRAPDTHARCIFPLCNSSQQHVVPLNLRVRLFVDHKYYVAPNCRICEDHIRSHQWTELYEGDNVNHAFTAAYIEDFCELLKKDKDVIIDFNRIERMDDNIVWYWVGRSKEQFREIELSLPNFSNRATALGAYLIKLRAGDSDERISTILNLPRTTLNQMLHKVRQLLLDNFVPAHLGLNHMTREDVARKNLYIPDSLFGNPGSDINNKKAIVIMDGTYIYVQKSSNYSYQKNTYSLHKYRNLVKPFIVVCCDGYILDVLGPHPATKSDAEILNEEFSEPSKPMRQYFREGDVIILDRGFRDSITNMQNMHYCVHYPLSLEQGEFQLSTEKANESRKVTLCRWVVEVVNGRFKRDFKLLRQEYFNKASNHLMKDFLVAAALINTFHPVLQDRADAREIVSVIQEKMFTNNTLADFVEVNNLNRRRAHFFNLSVDINNLQDFPRMGLDDLILISLGTYQIKQARSYYGEHVRQDGSYIIEVCREVDEDLINELGLNCLNNVWILRGKIHSRHISRKTYFIYVLINNNERGRDAIIQYCCNCIVGRRTIGCCAHTMTIIWYLSYARYQENIDPPASFLDNILLENIDD